MTKESNAVLLSIENRVATLTLNRPDVHNAFDDKTIGLILAHLQTIIRNSTIRVLVLTHTGKHFCAGADLNWMKRMAAFSRTENLNDAKQLGLMLKTIYELPIPTIAVIRGAAFGGGAGLAAVCKIVLAAEDAHFCFSETKLGLIPATISPYVVHAIGARQALNYFITAEKFMAIEALRLGLCHRVVPGEALAETLQHYLDLILKNGPDAIKACFNLVNILSPAPISDDILNFTTTQIANIRSSKEGQAGIQAFLDKRQPDWM